MPEPSPLPTDDDETPRRWRAQLPSWLSGYGSGFLRADLLAGITLTAYLLPAAIGDASLANLPAEAGIYACICGGLVFWLFCSSRHTAITVTSAISLLLGSSLGELAGAATSRGSAPSRPAPRSWSGCSGSSRGS